MATPDFVLASLRADDLAQQIARSLASARGTGVRPVLGPRVVGLVSAAYGCPTAIAGLALLYLIDIVALLALIPERRGVDLA